MSRFPVLPETPAVFSEWWRLVGTGVSGKRAHDARLVALMTVHGVRQVLTFNLDDFRGFTQVNALAPGGG